MTWTTLLWCRLLSSSKSCLKEMWRRLEKEKKRENRKDIRPVHGWQRRGGGCMHITPGCMEGLRVEDPQSFFNYLRIGDGAYRVWRTGTESGAKDREAGCQREEGASIPTRMRPECFECCWNVVRLFRMQYDFLYNNQSIQTHLNSAACRERITQS